MMAEWILAAEKLTIAEDTGPIQWRADIAVRRGVIALHRGMPADARDHLARAAALEPSRVEVRLLTAQAYLASRQHVSAIDTLRGILSLYAHRLRSGSGTAHLGECCARFGAAPEQNRRGVSAQFAQRR